MIVIIVCFSANLPFVHAKWKKWQNHLHLLQWLANWTAPDFKAKFWFINVVWSVLCFQNFLVLNTTPPIHLIVNRIIDLIKLLYLEEMTENHSKARALIESCQFKVPFLLDPAEGDTRSRRRNNDLIFPAVSKMQGLKSNQHASIGSMALTADVVLSKCPASDLSVTLNKRRRDRRKCDWVQQFRD